MSGWEEWVYPHLPILAQNVACSLRGASQRKLRYGGEFQQLLAWLEESQWWTMDRIQIYQEEQLGKIIRHAYATVPYYRNVFDQLKLKPSDIRTAEDLSNLPVLTKEDVRQHLDELVSQDFARNKLVFGHTSGTSGKSLQFYHEPWAIQFRWAVWWRHRKRFGIEFDAPYAGFTGLTAVPLEQELPPYWRENWPMRQTIFTMHHVTAGKVEAMVRRLNQGGFAYYSGYPSILFVLAELIQESRLEISAPPKIVFTGAENLYENQRAVMSAVYKCPVTDEYGFSEGCGNASRCPQDVYHEDFEYGILECEAPEQMSATTKRGRIVATGFASYAMPFIRYDVGDIGMWRSTPCTCGRHSKVLVHVEGRIEDYVITPEGRKIMRFDYIFKDTHNIRDAQVVQGPLGSICLRIVRRPAYSAVDEALLREEIKQRVSSRLGVEFEYVDEIERELNGKIRAVKSLVEK